MIERIFRNKRICFKFKDQNYSTSERNKIRKGLSQKPVEHDSDDLSIDYQNEKYSLRDYDDTHVNYSHILLNNRYSEFLKAAMDGLSGGDSAETIMKTLEEFSEKTFVDVLLEKISEKNVKDSEIYRAAHIDRRLFSKIISNRMYKPSKDTCILLCLAIHLKLSEAKDFLSRAGYTFTHSNKRDIIIEYFFKEKIYNIDSINEILYDLNFKTLSK